MEYYIINGYCEQTRYTKNDILNKNSILINFGDGNKIHRIFFKDENIRFVIESNNIFNASKIALLFRAFLWIYYGYYTFSDYFCLLKISKIPSIITDEKQIIRDIIKNNDDIEKEEMLVSAMINSGTTISIYRLLKKITSAMKIAYKYDNIYNSLINLLASKQLCDISLGAGYYELHYIPERLEINENHFLKDYLLNKHIYYGSFNNAFKALESLLNVQQIKKQDISKILLETNTKSLHPTTMYTRKFEIISTNYNNVQKNTTIFELINYFLTIRNSTTAHQNKKKNEVFYATSDQVLEIQFFVSEKLFDLINSYQKN